MQKIKIQDIVLAGMFAALMAVGANVSSFLMIGGVPVTLQLMFAIIAGGILGSRLGTISMLVYVLIGLAGAPVFAQFKGGPAQIFSHTFGFIVSFIVIAYVAGKLIGDRKEVGKKNYIMTGFLSIFFNYIIGTNFMYLAFKIWVEAPDGFSYLVAWLWMAAYLPVDIGVTIISISVIPRLKAALRKNRNFVNNTEISETKM